MREIKFRAYHKHIKQIIGVVGIDWEQKEVNDGGRIFELDMVELMQYTGLKDKNGKEIYEGDIVKWGHLSEWTHENPVRIAEVKICPDIEFHSQVGVFQFGSFSYQKTEEALEVIGNIHENSELLKGAK